MNQENNTPQATLIDHCLTSLLALGEQELMTSEQQDLYDRIVACKDPEDWPEEHFSTEVFQEILEQAKKLEDGRDKIHNILSKLENIPASRAPLVNYI